MMLIRLSLAVLAAAPMALLAVFGACCRWVGPPAAALPRPRGEWYPRTLPPGPEPSTQPLPAASDTERQIAAMWHWAELHGVGRPA